MLGVSPFQELKIAEVNPDSLGAKAGLQIGDIVRRIDDTAITSFATYAAALEARPAASATLEVERAGAAVSLSIPPRTDTVHAAELGLGGWRRGRGVGGRRRRCARGDEEAAVARTILPVPMGGVDEAREEVEG